MIQNIYLGTTTAARWLAYLGVVSLFGAMGVTIADIVMRTASRIVNLLASQSVGWAITGVVDMVQLLVMAAAFLAIPFAFLRDAHVSVDMLTRRFSPRVEAVFKAAAAFLATGFMWVVLATGYGQALTQIQFGDETMTIGIPFSWFWAPMLGGVGFATLATLLLGIGYTVQAATGRTPFGGVSHFPETDPEAD